MKLNLKHTLSMIISLLITFSINVINAKEYKVQMKNSDANGNVMVFDPPVLKINVGDTVKFIATDMAHNSQSIDGMTPKGSVTWIGDVNEEISVTIDKEGVYVYKCQPHLALAMVGVIVAGKPINLDDVKKKTTNLSSQIYANKTRLEKYLSEIK